MRYPRGPRGTPPIKTEKECPACHRKHTRVGQHCGKHEARIRQVGSATGIRVKAHDLDIYRPLVATMLNRYADDPAIVAGLKLMEDILATYGQDADHATVGRRCRPYLDKLLVMGATVRTAFIECAAVNFMWEITEAKPTSAEMDMALATRLLLHKRTWNQGMGRSNWSRAVIGGLGYRIRCDLGTLFLQMAKHCVKQDMAHRSAQRTARDFAPMV
jgi:hypothetical protein